MSHDEVVTRRLVAVILGGLGFMILLDVLIIATVHPSEDYDGFRQALFLVIAGLLVVGGVVTFAWPKRNGNIESRDDEDEGPARSD